MNCRPDKGTTLIELLISISIVGVILVIIMGALRIGIRAWETGERDIDGFQRRQIVLSILKRQLSSIYLRPIRLEDGKKFIFQGDESSVDFVSGVSVIPGSKSQNVRVSYRVAHSPENKRCCLEIAERTFLADDIDQSMTRMNEDRIYTLIDDAAEIRFGYFVRNSPEAAGEWQETWDNKETAVFPSAVKCVLRMDKKTPAVVLIARVLSQNDIF